MRIIPRHEWGGRAPLGPPMTLPVGEANLHHSVSQLTSDPLADMRAIERIGIERFGRFSYSFAYHRPSRALLVGAGDTIGAHTAGRNSRSLGLVLIGNFDITPLDDTAVADLGAALRWLVHTGRLRPDFTLKGHRDWKATACPGRHAYARLGDIRAAYHAQEDDMDGPTLEKHVDAAVRRVLNDSRQGARPWVTDRVAHAHNYAKTAAVNSRALLAQVAGLTEAVNALALGQGHDPDAIEAAVRRGAEAALRSTLGSLDEDTGNT